MSVTCAPCWADHCWQCEGDCGCVHPPLDATDSPASVSLEQTPTPADNSAHSGDQCTVPGATP